MSETTNRLPYNIPEDPRKYADVIGRRTAWLRRQFGRGVQATSAIHDVLLRVLQRRAGGEDLPVRGFWRAVMRKVFDQFRRNRRNERFMADRRAALREGNHRSSAASPCEQEVMNREVREAIDRCVMSLAPADRDLMERLAKGQSHQQIAEATGRTVAAVKQAAHRVRLRIRNGVPADYRPGNRTAEDLGND